MPKSQFLLRRKFNKLSAEMPVVFRNIKGGEIKEFLMPFWDQQNQELENFFMPNAPFDFLSHPSIRNTMFVSEVQGWIPVEIPLVEKIYANSLPSLAREDVVGLPEILSNVHGSSSNLIHHLYHFAKFESATGAQMSEINSVVEWGGGYGNMAKLYRRLNSLGTYTIIDTDLFCALQWLYLCTLLSNGSVNIIMKKSDKILKGKINILPLKYLKTHIPNGELFISTWGLSESTIGAQDFVVKNNWFRANKLLLGYQKSIPELSHASRLGELAKKAGAKIEETIYIKNNYYAFK